MGNQQEAKLHDEIALGKVEPYVYTLPIFLTIYTETPIEGCTFEEDVAIQPSGFNNLIIKNCQFEKSLKLVAGRITKLDFLDGTIINQLLIEFEIPEIILADDSEIKELIQPTAIVNFKGGEGKNAIGKITTQHNATLKNIYINELHNKGIFSGTNCRIKSIESSGERLILKDCREEKVKIQNKDMSRDILIENCSLDEFIIDSNNEVTGEIKNSDIDYLIIKNYKPGEKTTLTLNNTTLLKEAIFSESSLKNINFLHCDLRNSRFKILRVIPKDLDFESVKWPRKEFVDIYKEEKQIDTKNKQSNSSKKTKCLLKNNFRFYDGDIV